LTAGGWLFRQRTWIPVPLALALLFLPSADDPSVIQLLAGATIVALGEGVRLWAVRHIGVISRTRSDRLGPVIRSGPFARLRNPLYLGNIALWVGLAVSAHLLWLAPIFVVLLGLEYHAIVRWEEELLRERRGDDYAAYAQDVPRWIPSIGRPPSRPSPNTDLYSWRDTLFSERGTLIGIAAAYLLLLLKTATLPF
jgi:protein-S-isoprenylcysteine O-methyltransferase Ste14